MTWQPTDQFLHGRIIKPFLPFEKHPTLRNSNLKNLYPGDEVFVFETKDNKWARGYSMTRPFPSDFAITSVNLDDLPGINKSIVVFPLRYVKIIDTIPLTTVNAADDFNNVNVTDNLAPTLMETERDAGEATAGTFLKDSVIPPLPFESFTFAKDLEMEIIYTLNLLTSHIYAMYSIGEFRLFKKLASIFTELDETRVKLISGGTTRNELRVVEETATHLLSMIPKLLASKAARMNEKSYDLENKGTDISGYKAVLARDAFSGELLSLENTLPSQLAVYQQFCALAPKFPINAHSKSEEYLLKPPQNKKLQHGSPSHILVDFKSVNGSSQYTPPGFAGMIAYMYIRNSKKRLTEAFAVHTENVSELLFVEKISAALFRNIPASEVDNNRVYLVAVLAEELDMTSRDNAAPHVKRITKGVAAGVTDITRIFSRNFGSLASGEAHQFSINLFGSYVHQSKSSRVEDLVENMGWGELVDRIIKGVNHGVAVNPRAEKLVVTVKEFKHQLAEDAAVDINKMKDNPQSTKAAPIARIKPIFYDPLADNYERIYLKMGKAKMNSSINKNDLLTFRVSAPNNESITFAKASNQLEKPVWQFVSVFSGESIGEIVKVNGISLKSPTHRLPKQDSLTLTLFVNGVYAGEGSVMYKSGNRLVEYNKKESYTVDIISPTTQRPIAQVGIHTEYIGKIYNTELAIDNILLYSRFFVDGQLGLDDLVEVLLELCKLDISQLVRFFSEIIRSLFEIIAICIRGDNNLNHEIVLATLFKAVVHLLDTVFGKQDQYLFMFEKFVLTHEKDPAIGVFLLDRMAEVFSQAESNWNTMSRSICRVIVLLIGLALAPLGVAQNKAPFIQSLKILFNSAANFISLKAPALINDQILIIELVDFIMVHEYFIDDRDMLSLVMEFIDSIGTRGLGADEEANLGKKSVTVTKEHKFILTKLLVLYRLFGSNLAKRPQNAYELVSRSVNWCMEVFLGPLDIDATRIACSVMNCVCDLVWKNINVPEVSQIALVLSRFLFPISKTFIRYNKFTRGNEYFNPKKSFTPLFPSSYPFKEIFVDGVVSLESLVEVLAELATISAYIARIGNQAAGEDGLYLVEKLVPDSFFDPVKYTSGHGLNEDVHTVLAATQLIRQGKFFPEEKWLSMYGMIADGVLLTLKLLRKLLLVSFIPEMDQPELFDRSLWGSYLRALLKLAVLPPVSIEHLSTIPRKACLQITGKMRDEISSIINETWDALAWEGTEEDVLRFNLTRFGGYQVEFINSEYGILQNLMLFALQMNPSCQIVSVKILWSILVSEHILSNSIVDVEKEYLTGLYDVFYRNGYKPSKLTQTTFVERLKNTIRLDREDVAYNGVTRFISNLSGFLEVLNDLNSVPVGPEFEDDRTFHKLNVNAYLKQANKPELFHSFVNQMYEDNLKKKDYVQAALSLELLSSTYEWDHYQIMPASYRPRFPQQSAFERKEALVKMVAQNYVTGKSLERAIDVYNDLLAAYSEHTYDLKSFAFVHNKLATLYLDLESSDKLSPSYFRVAFIGIGFPANIRGKEQIIEGRPFEHITSVHERLLKVYPGAKIVVDDEFTRQLKGKNLPGRYLLVNAVEPVYEISDKLLNTSIGARQYARNKDLRYFSILKKIPGATSIFDLWTEEITYETTLSFPTLMNRSDVKETTSVRLSPLENAIRAIMGRNDELVSLESMINIAIKEKADHSSLLSDLSRNLAGTVEAPVNGGVGQYRTFLQDPRYVGKEIHADNIRLLKNAFNDLTLVLSRCLHLHSLLVNSSMKMAHEALVDSFKKNFAGEIGELNIKTNYDSINYEYSGVLYAKEKKIPEKSSTSSTNGTSLYRTPSKSSKSSLNSGSNYSDPSLANSQPSVQRSTTGTQRKRTALNWRALSRENWRS